jgi:hypothetical protein
MFTWICPQCGREVSPSYDECPDCKARLAAAGPAPPPQPPQYPPPPYQPVPGPEYVAPQPPPQQQAPVYYQRPPEAQQPASPYYQPQQPPTQAPPQGQPYYAPAPPQQPPQPPPQYYQPPPQQPAPPPYYPPQAAPPARHALLNLPPWLMTIVFAAGIGGIIFGIYSLLQTGKTAGSGPTPVSSVESPAAKPGAKPNALQKQIEITGVRFSQDAKKKTLVTFVIINHSQAEISGLAGNVTIWGRTQKSEEDAQGTFAFTTDLAPYQSKEISAPLNSKLKIYELPDWQNITTDVQITAPAG